VIIASESEFEQFGIGTWLIDRRSGVGVWSDLCLALLGFVASEAKPTRDTMFDFLFAEDRDRIRTALAESGEPASLAPWAGEVRVATGNGSFRLVAVNVHFAPYADGTGLKELGLCSDIAGRTPGRRGPRGAADWRAAGNLTVRLVHDVNNLLSIVSLNVEAAQDALRDQDPSQALLHAALEGVIEGTELNRRLLASFGRQRLRPANSDLLGLIREACSAARSELGARYQIEVLCPTQLPQVFVDGMRFRDALRELVRNARDAMREGGRITIEVAETALETGRQPAPARRHLVVSVRDSGDGMTGPVREKAFDPFFTTKPPAPGRGLGLSAVLGFLRQSGGDARIDSEADRGTTVRLYLPLD